MIYFYKFKMWITCGKVTMNNRPQVLTKVLKFCLLGVNIIAGNTMVGPAKDRKYSAILRLNSL